MTRLGRKPPTERVRTGAPVGHFAQSFAHAVPDERLTLKDHHTPSSNGEPLNNAALTVHAIAQQTHSRAIACPSSYWGVKYSNPSMSHPASVVFASAFQPCPRWEGQAVNLSMPQRWVAPSVRKGIVRSRCRDENPGQHPSSSGLRPVHIHSRSLPGSLLDNSCLPQWKCHEDIPTGRGVMIMAAPALRRAHPMVAEASVQPLRGHATVTWGAVQPWSIPPPCA